MGTTAFLYLLMVVLGLVKKRLLAGSKLATGLGPPPGGALSVLRKVGYGALLTGSVGTKLG